METHPEKKRGEEKGPAARGRRVQGPQGCGISSHTTYISARALWCACLGKHSCGRGGSLGEVWKSRCHPTLAHSMTSAPTRPSATNPCAGHPSPHRTWPPALKSPRHVRTDLLRGSPAHPLSPRRGRAGERKVPLLQPSPALFLLLQLCGTGEPEPRGLQKCLLQLSSAGGSEFFKGVEVGQGKGREGRGQQGPGWSSRGSRRAQDPVGRAACQSPRLAGEWGPREGEQRRRQGNKSLRHTMAGSGQG